MAIQLISGATSDTLTVDGTSKAARVTLYGTDGSVITPADAAAIVPGTQRGLASLGSDSKIARIMRVSSTGSASVADDTIYMYDSREGAAVDVQKWIQTTTTMTITQAAGVVTFNAGSSFATTVGALQQSHRLFPLIQRGGLLYRSKARATAHFSNNIIELGFGVPSSSTSQIVTNGAFWRKDSGGQWVPVVSNNTAEITGTPISNATFIASVPVTDYAQFEVFVEDNRATFQIMTQNGTLLSKQVLDFGTNGANAFYTTTHLQCMERTFNTASTGTAVQLLISGTVVQGLDVFNNRSYESGQVGTGYGSMRSPTAYTQLATNTNSGVPANATLANATAGYTTLGGLWNFAAIAGAVTDYALFAIQIPTPYSFYVQRIKISAWNNGAAVATTATLLQWSFSTDLSAASLATGSTYPGFRKTIGSMSFPVGAAIGQAASNECEWTGLEMVHPARFFHIILRMPVGTATASQVVHGTCSVDGYFE